MVAQRAEKKRVSYKKLLAEKELALGDAIESLQRLQAEFDNFRKRNEVEKADIIDKASKNIVVKLLDVFDSLNRASAESSDKEGFELVRKQFGNILINEGLEPIDTAGQGFDPELHDAIITQKSDEAECAVIKEIRKGYKFKGEVIRPAQVIISKRGEENE